MSNSERDKTSYKKGNTGISSEKTWDTSIKQNHLSESLEVSRNNLEGILGEDLPRNPQSTKQTMEEKLKKYADSVNPISENSLSQNSPK
jgi:hypothetical protein